MSWTDERVELLSRLWLEGLSASQIATALGSGLTRNAVIGKVHRLGLAGRVKPASAPAPEEAPRVTETAPAPVRRPAPRATAAVVMAAAASAPAPTMTMSRSIEGNTALAMEEAAPVVQEAEPARAPEEVVVPLSVKVTIVELRESMCKWPLGDPSSADFRYCGSPSFSTTPYCQHHGKIAYQPAQDRRQRERERRPLLAR